MIFEEKDQNGKVRVVVSKYWPDGKRFRRRVPNRTVANKLLDTISGAIATGTWLELRRQLTELPETPVTIKEFAETYKNNYCDVRNKRPEFKKFNLAAITRLLGDVPVKEFNRSHAAYFERERAKEVTKATVNRGLAVLKNLFTYALTEGVIQIHPLTRYRMLPEDETVLRVMTLDEERRLVTAVMEEEHTIGAYCGVLGETGLRMQEGLRLKWEYVNIKQRKLTVEASKNGKGRHVPLESDYALELLGSLTRIVGCPYVFARLETMTRWHSPRGPLLRARKTAKLEWVGFHDFRHFRATQWIQHGMDIRTVQELLGHEDIETTMRYVHYVQSHASVAVAAAHKAETAELTRQ